MHCQWLDSGPMKTSTSDKIRTIIISSRCKVASSGISLGRVGKLFVSFFCSAPPLQSHSEKTLPKAQRFHGLIAFQKVATYKQSSNKLKYENCRQPASRLSSTLTSATTASFEMSQLTSIKWSSYFVKRQGRPERWIVTIPSSDQWLATIENHWKTIVSNGCQTTKPLKNHLYQWFSDQKPLENHCYQWFWRLKTIVKPLTSMVAFQPFI